MARTAYLLALIALSQLCDAYKILVVFPLAGKSHNILGQGYVKPLLEAGHEVTYVTPFPSNKTIDRYREIDISADEDKFDTNIFSLKAIINKETSMDLSSMLPMMLEMTRMTLENDKLVKFLNDPTQNFDVVIVEWLYSDVYAGFATVFNCPLIWSSSMEPHWMILRLIHEPSNPAFNPDALSASVPPFSFRERVESLLMQLGFQAAKYFYLIPGEIEIFKNFFGPIVEKRGRALPPFEEAIYNASFLLTNSHSSVGQSISVPPNSKEIGGYHINPNPQPLPAELQKLMDEAEHGVIYFSMGSNAKSKDFPDSLKKDFLRVLGEMKQTVIWKFEEDLPNRPKNVHIVQWAPQTSILAHPKCRLFITHGGLLSTSETIHFGVPTIVMPYGADQHLNAMRAVKKGYALKVDLSYEMAGDLKEAMVEMLRNPKYTQRVKELSKIYHARLTPPAKELVHWVEYVIETGGARHLRSPALLLPWYQKMYLDLVALLIVIYYAVKFLLKKLFSKVKSLFSKKTPKVKTN